MSCADYVPERDNASETDSDYNVESFSSSEEEGMDCGKCWDCEAEPACPAKIKDMKNAEKKIQKMIKEEVDKIVKPKTDLRETKEFVSLSEMTEEEKSKLTDLEKINKVAIAFHRNGGINLENIIELKQLVILVSATAEMEGFKEFPRKNVLKLLDMLIYHANSHMASLDI